LILFSGFTSIPAKAWNCVEFVHKTSSFQLSGNAWQWWRAAAGHYDRGKSPAENAVLVFDRSGAMQLGHVALVSRLIDRRTIEIDHANWSVGPVGRGKIARNMRVIDVSARNDWTSVRVWNDVVHDFGRPYKALGFIYAR
jgi:surface antigen